MKQATALVTAGLLASFAMAGPAWSAGDTSNQPSKTANDCKTGEVWDKEQKKCVAPKKGEIDDDSIYEAGRDLAYAYRYDEAIDVLQLAANRSDPRILNFLGYANRKAGRLEVGIGYYREAIAIDPAFTLARSYYGEALLLKEDVSGAMEQLAAIEKLCGSVSCKEYADLAFEIRAYRRLNGG
jgi:tetratricopeptide (TPR) repeat protein